MKIGILGGGIGGLSTAIALKQKGFDVDVFERYSRPTEIGAGIVCWPNASFVLEQLGVLNKVAKVSGSLNNMNRFSNNGEPLGSLDINKLNQLMGYPSYSIIRKDLMSILTQRSLELSINIHYQHNVTSLLENDNGKVCVRFSNGKNIEPDLIVGSDGRMNSFARKYVNGENDPIYQGFINWIGVFEYKSEIFTELSVSDYWGFGERFGIVPISSTKAYWAGGVAAAKIGDNKPSNYKTDLLTLFNHWPSPIRDIINETPLVDINKVYVHDHNPMDTWHRDNVLVIGDAAHASLPTSGQGACQAIEDAWHLAELLEKHDGSLESLFQTFTKMRFSKTTNITMGARQFASLLFNTDEDASEQRNRNSKNTDYNAVISGMAKGWSSGLPICV